MIKQAAETLNMEEVAPHRRWLTPQEIERRTQPSYERFRAEMSEYWRKRFQDRRRQEEAEKIVE